MDLRTSYLGISLESPFVASASPLSRTLDGIRQLEDAGAAAVVLFSLFEEQIAWEDRLIGVDPSRIRRAPGHLPDWGAEPVGPDEYLDLISLAKRSVDLPVIGSINGTAPGNWTRYARLIEGAGADALELNLYFIPADPALSADDVEKRYLDTLREVRQTVTCPLAVKIAPYFSALPSMAERLVAAGADALVLFNRFYEPDFDIETRNVNTQNLVLSTSDDLRLPLRWISLLYGNVTADLALTSGVHSHTDAIKAVMAGASVVMVASELMKNGVGRIGEMESELARWLTVHNYQSLSEIRGVLSARRNATDAASSERSGYVTTVRSQPPGATADTMRRYL